MTGIDTRPRSFAWINQNGRPVPYIIFEEPRVGCEGMTFLMERRLMQTEYGASLDVLARQYPLAVSGEVEP